VTFVRQSNSHTYYKTAMDISPLQHFHYNEEVLYFTYLMTMRSLRNPQRLWLATLPAYPDPADPDPADPDPADPDPADPDPADPNPADPDPADLGLLTLDC
jgi:hypothetical protein